MATDDKLPGDDKKTGKFVLLVDEFNRVKTRSDTGQILATTRHLKGERLHLTDEDADRLLNTDPPAVKRVGDDDPVPGALLPGTVPEVAGEGSNAAQLQQAKVAADAQAAEDLQVTPVAKP